MQLLQRHSTFCLAITLKGLISFANVTIFIQFYFIMLHWTETLVHVHYSYLFGFSEYDNNDHGSTDCISRFVLLSNI